jgi:hypothetical protein
MSENQDTKAVDDLYDVKTEIFNKITGPRGANAVLEAAKKKLEMLETESERLKQRASFIEGQKASTKEIVVTLEMMIKECGLKGVVTIATGSSESPVATEEKVVVDEEVEAHKAKGLCLFTYFVNTKDGRKRKFCNRRGNKKKYQGYCKIHWDRVQGGKED